GKSTSRGKTRSRLRIRSAIVAEITIYFRSVLFAHKCREYIFADFRFLAHATHFLKLRSTLYSF
ncbi:MAG: hypothetical protein WB586_05740, partial [Chthoniobacterales bacterium]